MLKKILSMVRDVVINGTVVDPEKRFFLKEGPALSSLEELFQELQVMEDHVFYHHVNDQKNDFANWVRDVFQDRFLAKNLELAKDKDSILKILFMSLFR